jgi:GAF domain-containing protein
LRQTPPESGGSTEALIMVDYGLLHRELAGLTSDLGPETDLHEGLYRLTVAVAAALEVDGAGVTLRFPGADTHYITAADPVTLHVERRQDELREGACVDAVTTARIVAVADLTSEHPWPRLGPVLLEAGFHAAAAVPVLFQGTTIGAVNLYACSTHLWTTEEFDAARLVAELAAGYLINQELLRTTQTLVEQLQFALDSRIVIEQAKGLLAGRHGFGPDAAFELMRGYARHSRTRLREVAAEIVGGDLDLAGKAQEHDRG